MQIFSDPQYHEPTTQARVRISWFTCWHFLEKRMICITPSRPLLGVTFGYHTHSAYANIAMMHPNKSAEVIFSATTSIYWNNSLRLLVPYLYSQELAGEPPDLLSWRSYQLLLFMPPSSGFVYRLCASTAMACLPCSSHPRKLLLHQRPPRKVPTLVVLLTPTGFFCHWQFCHLHYMQWQESICREFTSRAVLSRDISWDCLFRLW